MKTNIPCGVCPNCLQIAKVQDSVLKCCNPPFSHADQSVIDVWNDSLQRYPCTQPMTMRELNETERLTVLNVLPGQKEICGYKRGDRFVFGCTTWLFYDAQAEGSSWEGIVVTPDGSKIMERVPPALLEKSRRYM